MKYDNKKTILLGVFFIAVLFLLILFLINTENNKSVSNNIVLVNDPSEFYTVSSCLTKYVTYVSSKDNEKIYIMLDSNYIDKNNITVDNVFDFISLYDGEYTQSSIRMYSQQINSYTTKYYVKYVINQSIMDVATEDIIQYAIVVLNERELSFSIEPYDGEMFINE